ncbi:hypothetical protein M501DRAFT_997146 [Patellaria atrata CBS 101060]|uniref:Dpy-30 domain-containing protein n=1 Tax=Patellaria atrata CBS 101060 TaxID=1346257 RepID=A0A9P4S548_9PEZI|nr:hypothetical protein M501DRAFT_997146 [Patellaria atrata CBS 101060]
MSSEIPVMGLIDPALTEAIDPALTGAIDPALTALSQDTETLQPNGITAPEDVLMADQATVPEISVVDPSTISLPAGPPTATAPVTPVVSTPPSITAPAQASQARSSPHPHTQASVPVPKTANPHGSPTRVYLNQKVTPHLLEGMKLLAVNEPAKPLQWLSEFLAERSREVEGS